MEMAVEGASDELQVSPEARLERLTRRIAALERQVEARIAQVEDLQRRLAHAENVARVSQEALAEAEAAKPKAAEYDALMNTVTMRALRLPRSWYAAARRRLPNGMRG